MANLYDLELQESNNFIHLLLQNGLSPSLKLLEDQKEMSASMGPAGEEIVKSLEDPTSELGKSYQRLHDLEKAVQEVMVETGMTQELAESASSIFKGSPASMDNLKEEERKVIQDYWIKKKMCIASLTQQKGFSYQEIFS